MGSSLETLAPGFLIAAPALRDPNFEHTVVLMCLHNDEGALGLVINRHAPVTIREIMDQLGVECRTNPDKHAMVGGPVAINNGLLLYLADPSSQKREDEIQVTDHLRLCPSRELLVAIGEGAGPLQYHMFLGHAGWGPGQLEQEISQGAWIPTPLHMDLIFSIPLESRWDEALRMEGLNPAQLGRFTPQA